MCWCYRKVKYRGPSLAIHGSTASPVMNSVQHCFQPCDISFIDFIVKWKGAGSKWHLLRQTGVTQTSLLGIYSLDNFNATGVESNRSEGRSDSNSWNCFGGVSNYQKPYSSIPHVYGNRRSSVYLGLMKRLVLASLLSLWGSDGWPTGAAHPASCARRWGIWKSSKLDSNIWKCPIK